MVQRERETKIIAVAEEPSAANGADAARGAAPVCVLVVSDKPPRRLARAFARLPVAATFASSITGPDAITPGVDAVILLLERRAALELCARIKRRYQVPLLPVLVLLARPARIPQESTAPDAWLPRTARPRDVLARVEELVRTRRAEQELVRLNAALAELAAENGRLYERARRDAESTMLLLRELQHRVRNNLAAIQELLVLERHRAPARPLVDALDVALARLRSMAALQDCLAAGNDAVDVAALARAVGQGALEVFTTGEPVAYEVSGQASLSARRGSALAIVLNELITNALKHAATPSIRVSIADDAETLEVIVGDEGRGMPEETTGGSGLIIARAVVKNELGGRLELLAADRGTRLRIAVPLAG